MRASICKGPVSNKCNSRSTSSRETNILLFKLGQTYARSEYPKYCFKDWRFLFWKTLCWENHPTLQILNQEQSKLVKEELKEMLLKRAIQSVSPFKNQYLSNLFLVSKRDGGNRPVINLKHLNNFIPYQHFKKEGLNLLQNMLQKRDYMCKLDLKDAHFCVPLKKESKKYVRF